MEVEEDTTKEPVDEEEEEEEGEREGEDASLQYSSMMLYVMS